MKNLILLFSILWFISCNSNITTITTKDFSSVSPSIVSISINSQIPNGSFEIIKNEKSLVYQKVDMDFDGKYDKILILDTNLKDKNSSYSFKKIKTAKNFPKHTNIHFAKKNNPTNKLNEGTRLTESDEEKATVFQMEGPAWENEKVAFRNYFDQRNGMDIFGKRTTNMVLNNVGIEGTNYHELEDWGMDILKVGASLGAGAIALKIDNKLYRISHGFPAKFKILREGPLLSTFELSFKNLKIKDRIYQVKHQISIRSGDNFYTSEVLIEGLKGDEELVAGIVNLHSDTLFHKTTKTSHIIYTHDKQSESGDMLGMGLIIPKTSYLTKGETPDKGDGIVSTYYTTMKLNQSMPTSFKFFTGWEKQNNKFKDRLYFESQIIMQ